MDKEEYLKWREKIMKSEGCKELADKFGIDIDKGIPKEFSALPFMEETIYVDKEESRDLSILSLAEAAICCPECDFFMSPALMYELKKGEESFTVVCPKCNKTSSILLWQTSVKYKSYDIRTDEQIKADEEVRLIAEEFHTISPKELSDVVNLKKQRAKIRLLVGKIGKHLGNCRKSMNKTQEYVSSIMGTKRSQISRMESGDYGGMTIEMFLRYWIALYGVFPDELSINKLICMMKHIVDEGNSYIDSIH